jgi:hypothetical protein
MSDFGKQFLLYDYDEKKANYPNVVSLRKLIRDKWPEWSKVIEKRYLYFSDQFCSKTRFWWLSEASRLNFLSWGSQKQIKPLLFRWALHACATGKEDLDFCESITEGGLPAGLAKYVLGEGNLTRECNLRERDSTLSIRTVRRLAICFKSVLKTVNTILQVFFYHVLASDPVAKGNNSILLMSEELDGSRTKGREYYFGLVYEAVRKSTEQVTSVCTSKRNTWRGYEQSSDGEVENGLWALNFLSTLGFLKALVSQTCFVVSFSIMHFKCRRASNREEDEVLLSIIWSQRRFDRSLINFCLYNATKRMLRLCNPRSVIIHYEEKPLERAVLLACQEQEIEVVGYVVHPMDKALMALREHPGVDTKPTPHKYGVCGPAVAETLIDWAGKLPNNVFVWGSGKEGDVGASRKKIARPIRRVLLLLSHPDEIRIFRSWLRNDSRLQSAKNFRIRRYWPSESETFSAPIRSLISEFDFVEENSDSLPEAFKWSDVAIFSSTSAGLLAGRYGVISIHIDLNDLYKISPCIDRNEYPLSSSSAIELADTLDMLSNCELGQLDNIFLDQQIYEQKIFSPVDIEAIGSVLDENPPNKQCRGEPSPDTTDSPFLMG